MKFLLDTHVWVWLLDRPEKISSEVRRELAKPTSELYLSPISVWEAHNLASRGRLRAKPRFPEWLAAAFAQTQVREAPVDFKVAEETARLHLPQQDLGDLFLAATAIVYDLTLVTADEQLLNCSWLKTMANA